MRDRIYPFLPQHRRILETRQEVHFDPDQLNNTVDSQLEEATAELLPIGKVNIPAF